VEFVPKFVAILIYYADQTDAMSY